MCVIKTSAREQKKKSFPQTLKLKSVQLVKQCAVYTETRQHHASNAKHQYYRFPPIQPTRMIESIVHSSWHDACKRAISNRLQRRSPTSTSCFSHMVMAICSMFHQHKHTLPHLLTFSVHSQLRQLRQIFIITFAFC